MKNGLIGAKNNVMPLVAKYQSTNYVFPDYITKVINTSDVINRIPISVRQYPGQTKKIRSLAMMQNRAALQLGGKWCIDGYIG